MESSNRLFYISAEQTLYLMQIHHYTEGQYKINAAHIWNTVFLDSYVQKCYETFMNTEVYTHQKAC